MELSTGGTEEICERQTEIRTEHFQSRKGPAPHLSIRTRVSSHGQFHFLFLALGFQALIESNVLLKLLGEHFSCPFHDKSILRRVRNHKPI
jgi:hypothetical protein